MCHVLIGITRRQNPQSENAGQEGGLISVFNDLWDRLDKNNQQAKDNKLSLQRQKLFTEATYTAFSYRSFQEVKKK